MAATPKLTSAMMQGGGVYDSIIGQTQTPKASDKVLMFLDRMAPADPVDNVVVWTDDEEPADHRVHMLLPDHRRKPHKPSSLSIENEQILDELAQSEMSYPHDEYRKASAGPRRPADERHRNEASLEDFGARGWTPKPVEVSSPENAYAMPSARPAGAHSRQGSRVPSRMEQRRPGSRPPSVRPPEQGTFSPPRVGADVYGGFGTPKRAQESPPVALEIDIREPSADGQSYDGNGVRSLPGTEPGFYAAGSTTPRITSPPPNAFNRRGDPIAPLKSPFRTPQGIAAGVALPGSRAPSAMGSRPASRMSAQQQVVRAPATDPYSTPKLVINHGHVRIPKSAIKTPIVDAAPYDEHVHGHVHEVVEQDSDVVVVREEDEFEEHAGNIDDDADIGHHVQEHYDVVGEGTQRSTTPKAKGMVLKAVSDKDLPDFPETEIVDVEAMNERQLVELLKTPAMRSDALDYGDVAQRALEMHHDEDLCVLLQAADDELQHPVVRKAVRKQIAARLRKLGMADDYDAVKGNPDMAAILHKEAYGSPSNLAHRRLPDDVR
ncbi:hypothetical protein M408DRAFT_241304 [Serendipita vermifera MAFF 305830]|uniref:Uncharacterized protein n=1 Tax=Serendipita vermifera MAFF 305830 TaxID=933852 RepID=A0A0C2XSQ3_SERVB|nr:hypothetical protein M408DRAFT_241304 [Serendipita vermifera MAFF 305830]